MAISQCICEVKNNTAHALFEQPQDPETFMNIAQDDEPEHGYASFWATPEWIRMKGVLGLNMVSFDQGPMGHVKKKPTSVAITFQWPGWATDLRGFGTSSDTSSEESNNSAKWAKWADGMIEIIGNMILETWAKNKSKTDNTPTTQCAACGADPSGICTRCERRLSPQEIFEYPMSRSIAIRQSESIGAKDNTRDALPAESGEEMADKDHIQGEVGEKGEEIGENIAPEDEAEQVGGIADDLEMEIQGRVS